MIKFNINNEYKDLDLYSKDLKKALKAICKILKIKQKYLLDLSIVDEKKIQQINKDFRQKDYVTDVISFAFNDNKEFQTNLLGEIFICYEKIIEQANKYEHSVRREYVFLFVHGVLHLLGYDHMTKEDEIKMFGIQEEVLDKIKITRG